MSGMQEMGLALLIAIFAPFVLFAALMLVEWIRDQRV